MKKRCDWRPIDNIRSCIVNRPPLVLFTACLLMVASALVYGGLYVRTHAIENPDILWDWNRLLTNMRQLSFCVTEPSAGTGAVSYPKMPQEMVDLYLKQLTSQVNVSPSHSSHAVLLAVTVYEPEQAFFQQNSTVVVASSVPANTLGVTGNVSTEIVNVTMFIDVFNATGKKLKANACVLLAANKDVFPTTRAPTKCSLTDYTKASASASTGDDAGGTVQKSPVLTAVVAEDCKERSRIETSYDQVQDLTVMLTETEKDLVHVHLIYSSYFMFLMVFAVFVYGLVRNKGVRHFNRAPGGSSSLSKDSQPM